jgi:hypothetical protein
MRLPRFARNDAKPLQKGSEPLDGIILLGKHFGGATGFVYF